MTVFPQPPSVPSPSGGKAGIVDKAVSLKKTKTIFLLLVSVVVCHTHAINITGVVKDNAGSGLEGVRMRLGNINFDLYKTNRVKTLECSIRLVKNK